MKYPIGWKFKDKDGDIGVIVGYRDPKAPETRTSRAHEPYVTNWLYLVNSEYIVSYDERFFEEECTALTPLEDVLL